MAEKFSKRRSRIAAPKIKKTQEQSSPPKITESSQIHNSLIMELEEAVEHLRQAINQTENLVNKISTLENSK